MATLEEQIEFVLGKDIGVSYQNDLTYFLTSGLKEVISRIVELKPQEAHLFTKESTLTTNSAVTLLDDRVVDVWRENGTAGQYEAATEIPARERYRATDVNSLSYRSKFNPGWYKEGNLLYVVPAPESAGTGKAIINHIAFDDTVAYNTNSGDITNFPLKYEYLVVLYAAIRYLNNVMGNTSISTPPTAPDEPIFNMITITEDTIGTTEIGAVTVGTSVDVSTVALSSPSVHSLSAPTYTKPTIATRVSFEDFWNASEDSNPFGDNDPGDFSFDAIPPADPALTSISYSPASQSSTGSITAADTYVAAPSVIAGGVTLPTYTKPSQTFDMAQFESFLETEEDSELAQIQLGRLNHEMQEWQSDIQNELNEFNKENAIYQAGIQEAITEAQMKNTKAMKQADIDLQIAISNSQEANKIALQNAVTEMQKIIADNDNKIKDYSAKITGYNGEVQAEIQAYTQKMNRYQTEMQTCLAAWQQTQGVDLQIYNADIQSEVNEFNKENVAFQASIQEEVQNLQVAAARVQKQADIEISEVQKQADIDMQKAQKDGDLAHQVKIQNVANDLQAKIQNTAKDLEAQISEYTQRLALYNANIQKYSVEVQDSSAEYQWLQDQYTRLKAEYDSAFMIGQPKQQSARRKGDR